MRPEVVLTVFEVLVVAGSEELVVSGVRVPIPVEVLVSVLLLGTEVGVVLGADEVGVVLGAEVMSGTGVFLGAEVILEAGVVMVPVGRPFEADDEDEDV